MLKRGGATFRVEPASTFPQTRIPHLSQHSHVARVTAPDRPPKERARSRESFRNASRIRRRTPPSCSAQKRAVLALPPALAEEGAHGAMLVAKRRPVVLMWPGISR